MKDIPMHLVIYIVYSCYDAIGKPHDYTYSRVGLSSTILNCMIVPKKIN